MELGEFQDLIGRWGDDVSCWPEQERADAEHLLTASSAARALLEEFASLRRALAPRPVVAPAGLLDRIVNAAAELETGPLLGSGGPCRGDG